MGKILLILFLFLFSLSLIVPFVLAQDLKEPPEPPILGEGGVLDRITNYLFVILLMVAAIFIIIAGFQFVTAAGDPEKLNKAKISLLYALIGVLVAFSAKGLVKLIETIAGPPPQPPPSPPPVITT